MDGDSELDWLIKLVALKEKEEFLSDLLCSRLITTSQEFREYLAHHETRIKQLQEYLPNNSEAIRDAVDSIYREIRERLLSFAESIGNDNQDA